MELKTGLWPYAELCCKLVRQYSLRHNY